MQPTAHATLWQMTVLADAAYFMWYPVQFSSVLLLSRTFSAHVQGVELYCLCSLINVWRMFSLFSSLLMMDAGAMWLKFAGRVFGPNLSAECTPGKMKRAFLYCRFSKKIDKHQIG